MRPAELAMDETPMLPVLSHVLDWAEAGGAAVEALVILQPTSPLRGTADIDAAVQTFRESKADTVVTVVEVPHQFSPASQLVLHEGMLAPFLRAEQPLRRQDKPRSFARNGPAVLVMRPSVLRGGALYGERTIGHVMDRVRSLDVDDAYDLWLAEQHLLGVPPG